MLQRTNMYTSSKVESPSYCNFRTLLWTLISLDVVGHCAFGVVMMYVGAVDINELCSFGTVINYFLEVQGALIFLGCVFLRNCEHSYRSAAVYRSLTLMTYIWGATLLALVNVVGRDTCSTSKHTTLYVYIVTEGVWTAIIGATALGKYYCIRQQKLLI